MKYIPSSTKQARLWVDAISKSLGLEKSLASHMYTRLCGFNNWDRLVNQIGSTSASPLDEQVTKDVLETRKAFYVGCLTEEFGMNEGMAEYIIERASPSSNKKPQRFSVNTESLYNDDSKDSIDLHQLFKDFGMDSGEGFDKVFEEFAREALGDDLPEDFSFENLTERMRISKPLDPGAWYDLCATIGWELDEESFRPEYVYGEESFFALKEGEAIPVFITSLSRAPSDVDDTMANRVMDLVEEYAVEELDCDEAILFWGQPGIKKIKDKFYTHFGMYYTEGQWHEFLINKDTTISDLFDQHNQMESIEEPPESLSDEGCMLATASIKAINHIDQERDVSFAQMGTKTGWNMLLVKEVK